MAQVLGVIPARLKSSRLPEKVLLAETGKPLIQHVYEAAAKAKKIDTLIVATDDQRVVDACSSFGAKAVLTSDKCASGTDRVSEAAQSFPEAEIVLNIQGDEPEMDAGVLDALVAGMLKADAKVEMGTVVTPWPDDIDIQTPGCVKVVCDREGCALYFSRSPIPHIRDEAAEAEVKKQNGGVLPFKRHIGLYAYRASFLQQFASMPPSALELAESLEQLRALESGAKIVVVDVEYSGLEVNTAEDYAGFVKRRAEHGERG